MFDDLALRRAKTMLVRQEASLLLQMPQKHRTSCTAPHSLNTQCRHVSSQNARLQAEQALKCWEACSSCRACP